MAWTAEDLPDLTGRSYVVTGANSGLGFETARALLGRGARVLLACRSPERAGAALDALRKESPAAEVEARALDLASLASVERFAEQTLAEDRPLHGLLNNAGIMAIPFARTADGFEMQLGTNHLGHFALTGRLLPLLLREPGARIVNVSSTAHRIGRMDWDDPHFERRPYAKWGAYGQSKLANLLFTYELQRRLAAHGHATIAVASHPGYAATNLQTRGPRLAGSRLKEHGMLLMNRIFSQSAAMGALPSLYAACAAEVEGGDFIGPDGFRETRGHPTKVGSSARSRNEEDQGRLWTLSEELTGVRYL